MASFESVLAEALQLNTLDKLRLIEKVTPKIEEEVRLGQVTPTIPHPSLWGTFQDLGEAPSDNDFEEARRELWSGSR